MAIHDPLGLYYHLYHDPLLAGQIESVCSRKNEKMSICDGIAYFPFSAVYVHVLYIYMYTTLATDPRILLLAHIAKFQNKRNTHRTNSSFFVSLQNDN